MTANTLATYIHQLDPHAIRFTETFSIRWYGLAYLVGFVLGWLLIRRVLKVGRTVMPAAWAADLVMVLALGAVVGGRLGYCVFYEPTLFTSWTPNAAPFWGVLAINRGGMASHGGIIGAALAALWFARQHKQSALFIFDLTSFGAPLGLLLGRLANFVNGELYGRPSAPDMPWAVQFPQELSASNDPHADAARQAFVQRVDMPDHVGWSWPAEQAQQGNQAVIKALGESLTPRHPSQLYAAFSEGFLVILVLLLVWRKPRKPGMVAAWFCITYAVMRMANEFFRLPDAQFIALDGTLPEITRGQWLSVAVLGFGVFLLVFNRLRKVEPLGSWRRGPWTDELAKLPVESDTEDHTQGRRAARQATRTEGGHVRRGKSNRKGQKQRIKRGARRKGK